MFKKAKLTIFGNGLSLLGSLLFIVIISIGSDQKERINSWGDYWIGSYLSPHQAVFDNLLEGADDGDFEAIKVHLEKNWDQVYKRDRIYPFKRKLLFTLVEELLSQNNTEEAFYWIDRWKNLDERDIDARAFFAQALFLSPDNSNEGFKLLEEGWSRFPHSPSYTRLYYAALVKKELNEEARKLKISFVKNHALTYSDFYLQGKWRAYTLSLLTKKWEKEVSVNYPTTIDADNWAVFVVNISPDTKSIRLNLPPKSRALISEVEITTNTGTFQVPLDQIQLRNMQRSDIGLTTSNHKRPYFFFKINQLINTSNQDKYVSVRIKIDVETPLGYLPLASFTEHIK